jgi:hypothetical protein
MADWLRRYKWDAWVTVEFRKAVSEERALARTQEWLAESAQERERVYGAAAAVYAAAVVEGGEDAPRHVHALVGGIGRHPQMLTALTATWRDGDVLVEPYHPQLDTEGSARKGAAAYILKTGVHALRLLGTPKRMRRRMRAD